MCQNFPLVSKVRLGRDSYLRVLREDRHLCTNSQKLKRKCAFSLMHMPSVLNNTKTTVSGLSAGARVLPPSSQQYKMHMPQAHRNGPFQATPTSKRGKALSLTLIHTLSETQPTNLTSRNK